MHYSTLLALLSAPLLALAQQNDDNAFKIPEEGLSAAAGEPLTLNWDPTTSGTVSLVLRSGSSNNLNEGTEIASGIENSGSYTWTPTNALTRGSDYTIEIIDDSDPTNTNYTPYFVLDTTNTVAQSTSIISLGSATSSPDLSTASPTGAATSLTGVDSLVTSTASGHMTASDASTASGASMTTGASGASSSAESSGSSAASASDAAGSASASADLNGPEQSGNAGSKKNAMVGVLGVVAMGAFAL